MFARKLQLVSMWFRCLFAEGVFFISYANDNTDLMKRNTSLKALNQLEYMNYNQNGDFDLKSIT